METSKTSTGETLFDLTSYVADTPVSLSAQQESEQERMTHDTFGLGYERPLATYDPITQSWRMYEATLLSDSTPFSQTLPASGMTQNGTLFQQPRLEHHTEETELLSWPTPTARDWKGASGWKDPKRNLADLTYLAQVRDGHRQHPTTWPTPTYGKLAGGSGAVRLIQQKYEANEITLEEKKAMQAGNGGSLNPMWVEWLMGFPIGWTDLEDSETP